MTDDKIKQELDGVYDRLQKAHERIAALEAKNEELRMALGQSIKQYQYLLMQYEPEKAAAMATRTMEKR